MGSGAAQRRGLVALGALLLGIDRQWWRRRRLIAIGRAYLPRLSPAQLGRIGLTLIAPQ
jgi:hypothetical protein